MAVSEANQNKFFDLSSTSLGRRSHPAKVLIFIEASCIRGAAKSLLTLLDGVADLTHASSIPPVYFSIATFHRGFCGEDRAPTEFLAAVRKRGVQVYVIEERHPWDPRVISLIRNVIGRADPDIIQTNNVKSHALIKAAGVHRKRRWIAFQHGYTATDFKMKCYNRLDRWSLRSADRVVVPCAAFKSQLLSCGVKPHRARVLHNAGTLVPEPRIQDINALRERFGFGRDTRVLLTIGRMSSEKGHMDLIEAMKLLVCAKRSMECNLVLVGFGPELPRLQAAVRSLGLAFRIAFAPDESDIVPFLYLADLFVLPSRSEGCPHVLLEAMGAGVPIVATAVGGIPEILTDGETAVLVDGRRPASLANGIMRMLQSPALARGCARQAREVLRSRFSTETYVRNLFTIYADVLDSIEADSSCACPAPLA